MQPIVKWQYEKLEGTLGLLEDHLADPDCPCHSAGENCARKHLKRAEDYCAETMIILARDSKSPDKEFDKLVQLAEEAKAYRRAEESLLCGKKPKQEDLCPVSWASKWRKYFETLLVRACDLVKMKDSGITYQEHIPMPMIINQGKTSPNEGIIPPEYKSFQVELNLVRSPNWTIENAPQINSFEKVQDLIKLMRKQDREWVMLILLDTRLRIVGLVEFAIGTADTALVSVLEVARMALKTNATNVIVVHNHPAGDPSPSDADRRLYNRLKDSLEKLEIAVPEFVVAGHRSDYSFQAGRSLPIPNDQRPTFEVVNPKPKQVTVPGILIPERQPDTRRIPVGIGGQSRLFEKGLRLADPVAESFIKVTGKCGKNEGKVCNFKVAGIDKVEASTASISELGKLISQIAARPDLSIRKKADQSISNKTWAVGTTTTTRYEFEYKIVDALKIKASHNPVDFTPTPGYPQELQPRNRDRAATRLQVERIAANLDPGSLLTDFHGIDRGTPIVGPDMVVESGNGRVMAMVLAYKNYPNVWAKYLETMVNKLQEFGLTFGKTEEKFEAPILVRVRLTQVDRKQFVEEANSSTVIQSSAIETGRSDANKITPEMLNSLEILEGENIEDALRSARNTNFVRQFVQKLSANEQARIVDAKGILSQDGIRRATLALFMATFKGEVGQKLAERFFESTDLSVRTVFNGLLRTLGLLSRAETLSLKGEREKEYAIGEDLAKVIAVLVAIKKQDGYTVAKYIAQMSMLERELDKFQERILLVLDENSRSAKKIAAILGTYAQMVIDSTPPNQVSLMPGLGKVSKAELFESAIKRAAQLEDAILGLRAMTKTEKEALKKFGYSFFPEGPMPSSGYCPTCTVTPPATAKPKVQYELYDFQKEGVAWLKNKASALLADEMGLGKTPQAIFWGADHRPVLVVVPASLIFNWKREISEMWRQHDKVVILDGQNKLPDPLPDWTVVTYGMTAKYLPALRKAGFQAVIIDEAHLVKNLDTHRTKAILELVEPKEKQPTDRPIPNRLAVTGTPILNRPIELFALLVFLGFKRRSEFPNFLQTYTESKVVKGRRIYTGAKNLGHLHQTLQSIMLRRLKKDVLKQLPPKTQTPMFVPISNAKEYKEAELDFIRYLVKTKGTEAARRASKAELITRMNTLRQLAAQGKVDAVSDWLKPCRETGNKVLVFSNFLEPLERLKQMKQVSSPIYSGSLAKENRQALVDKFQRDPDQCYFFGTVGAAGVGITLTSANRVAFLDLPWTPGGKVQAEDRAHRIGQKKPVEIVNVLAKGTIDERMMEILAYKEMVIAQAIDGKSRQEAFENSISTELLNSFIHKPFLSDPVQYVKEEDDPAGDFAELNGMGTAQILNLVGAGLSFVAQLFDAGLMDKNWLSKKIDFCNQTPEQISRVMNWRPLRDFLAYGTAIGKVKICEAGMGVGAYNITIFGINPKAYKGPKWMEVLKIGKAIPYAKEIHSADPYSSINLEVILPSEEPQALSWTRQEVIPEPAFRPPQGVQAAMFEAKLGRLRKTEKNMAKIKAKTIVIERAEGPSKECGKPVTLTGPDVWQKAFYLLYKWGKTAPLHGGYDKCDFKVTWEDGQTYSGRYDLKHPDVENPDLDGHIYHLSAMYAGRFRPAWMNDQQWSNFLDDSTTKQLGPKYRDFLDKYEIGGPSREWNNTQINPSQGRLLDSEAELGRKWDAMDIEEFANEKLLPEMMLYAGDWLSLDQIKQYCKIKSVSDTRLKEALEYLMAGGEVIHRKPDSTKPERWTATRTGEMADPDGLRYYSVKSGQHKSDIAAYCSNHDPYKLDIGKQNSNPSEEMTIRRLNSQVGRKAYILEHGINPSCDIENGRILMSDVIQEVEEAMPQATFAS
ncbi:MAG: hypothetical protein A9183_00705 [Dehalococcoides mccartyi]|uniref:SNF2-related protein n=1 Tax=Dehalococcoides mccartyi TaxID=61435 RepID=UPI000805D001|nr:SNF2-related protein [Dehalococcoides mccartyi]OBW62929.1 MAG: hypothetical protein A9183_00705 [Dehalococcoides mccartyi]